MEKRHYTAFENGSIMAKGNLEEVTLLIKKRIGSNNHTETIIFDDVLGRIVDVDFSGTLNDVQQRLSIFIPQKNKENTLGVGRPKLGVISREVSLLPQHWEWLALQPGGASGALRKLVDKANFTNQDLRFYQDALVQFMNIVAGDLPNYEEAVRMLYRKDEAAFYSQIEIWPKDIKSHTKEMASRVFIPSK